jgi:hypothetical protein
LLCKNNSGNPDAPGGASSCIDDAEEVLKKFLMSNLSRDATGEKL